MNIITLKEQLQNHRPTANGNLQYQQYVQNIILLFRKKLTEGSMMDANKISKQITEIINNSNGVSINVSPELRAQLCVLFVETHVKTKNIRQMKKHLEQLKSILPMIKQRQKKSVLYKVNCMVLFDMEFEGFHSFLEHEDRVAVGLYKNGKFSKAVQILERLITTNCVQYHSMRKVWIGRILLQSYDLSAFIWLHQVIDDADKKQNTTEQHSNINYRNNKFDKLNNVESGSFQKYEAKILFTSGFRILCEKKGKDPEISGVPGLQNKSIQYSKDIDKMKQIKNDIKQFNKLKMISQQCHEDYKIKNILEALKALDKLSYLPKSSLEQLDLRIQLSKAFSKAKRNKQARKEASRCKAIADDLGVLSWERKKILQNISNGSILTNSQESKLTQIVQQYNQDQSTQPLQKNSFEKTSNTKKQSSYKASLVDQNHITFKTKGKNSRQKSKLKLIQIQNMQNVRPSVKSSIRDNSKQSPNASVKISSRSPSVSQSEDQYSDDSKQNDQNHFKQKKKQRMSRPTYQYHRKTIQNQKRKNMIQEQPHCCLIF